MSTWDYLKIKMTSDDLTPWKRPIFYIHGDPIYDEDGYEYIEFPDDDYYENREVWYLGYGE